RSRTQHARHFRSRRDRTDHARRCPRADGRAGHGFCVAIGLRVSVSLGSARRHLWRHHRRLPQPDRPIRAWPRPADLYAAPMTVEVVADGLGFTEGPAVLADGRVAVTSISHG